MSTRPDLHRATAAFGAASVLSAAFVAVRGDFDFVRIRGWGVAVAVGLGAVALLAGLTRRTALTTAAGAAFLAAALAQLVAWSTSTNVLGGDGSTISWWLGLGAGLLTTGLAPRIWPDTHPEPDPRADATPR
jgi:hypothetical protein